MSWLLQNSHVLERYRRQAGTSVCLQFEVSCQQFYRHLCCDDAQWENVRSFIITVPQVASGPFALRQRCVQLTYNIHAQDLLKVFQTLASVNTYLLTLATTGYLSSNKCIKLTECGFHFL